MKNEAMDRKKKYQKPCMEVIDIAEEQMIASSIPDVGFSDDKVDDNFDPLANKRRGNSWELKRRGKFGDLWYDGE